MNGSMLGADPEQLRELAKLFSKYSAQLTTSSNQLHPAVMQAGWNGPDAQRFRQSWSTNMRPQILSASKFLDTTSKTLLAQAKEQETASSESSLSSSGGSTPSVPAPSPDKSNDQLREELNAMNGKSAAEVDAWWNGLTKEQQQELLTGKDSDGIPFAYYLAALGDKLPADIQAKAHEILVTNAKGSIPMFTQTDKVGIDGKVAWVHGGAHLASQITQNADGSVTLKLSGDIGGGVNTPGGSPVGVDATLTGELSKTYKFNSLEEALAAREQMLKDLPPDSFGDAKDIVSNPGEYLEKTLDNAAKDNGSTKEFMSAKGTLSVGVEGKIGKDANGDSPLSGSAKLEMAYERNLDDGTSSASLTAKLAAKLDLGDGMKFGGNGEVGVKVNLDGEGDLSKMTLTMKGSIEGQMKVQDTSGTPDPVPGLETPAVPKSGPSAAVTSTAQGTLQLELQNTGQNKALIESYMGNLASGNDSAAASDLQKIYNASGATTQFNTSAKSENNFIDFDSGVASVKAGTSTEITSNVTTGYKAPYSNDYEQIKGEERYGD